MQASDLLQKIFDFYFSLVPQRKPSKELASECKIIAHRGAWSKENPENTMAAFKACLNTGIWAIEFDLRWTKDNIPVVHHDENTQRVFKKNISIAEITFNELRRVLPQIPTFEEMVFNFGKKLHLMIELKKTPSPEQLQILQNTLSPLSPAKDYHFMALSLPILEGLHCFDPSCLIAVGRADLPSIYTKSLGQKLGGITGHYLLFSNKMLKEQKSLGRRFGVGFPASKNNLYREINRGIPWIFTNRAIDLQKILNNLIN